MDYKYQFPTTPFLSGCAKAAASPALFLHLHRTTALNLENIQLRANTLERLHDAQYSYDGPRRHQRLSLQFSTMESRSPKHGATLQTSPPELSPDSSSLSNARLTPDGDSDDSDLEMSELGESYKMQRRNNDPEKVFDAEDGEEDEDEDYEDSGRRRRRRASMSTVQSYQLYTPDEEKAVVRKFDRKLVLFVALLYMLSFLDRSSKPRLSS